METSKAIKCFEQGSVILLGLVLVMFGILLASWNKPALRTLVAVVGCLLLFFAWLYNNEAALLKLKQQQEATTDALARMVRQRRRKK